MSNGEAELQPDTSRDTQTTAITFLRYANALPFFAYGTPCREADDDTHIDFTTQPQLFRVRGLLTLPPLKMLHAQQLPPLNVQTQLLRPEQYGSGGGGEGAAGSPGDHGALR